MSESNTTNSIQLSAISNLDSRNLDISHITSDESFVNVVNNLSIEVSYTDTETNKIFSQKLALTDLFSAISSYVSYERSQNAEKYLRVVDEDRTWKPKPSSDGAALIEPQIASNSDNPVHNCQLLRIIADENKGQYIRGQVIEVTENGSIIFYGGIAKGLNSLEKCDNMLIIWSKSTNDSLDNPNIHLRSKSGIAFSTKNGYVVDQIINNDENTANFMHLSTGTGLYSINRVQIEAGSNLTNGAVPIQLISHNSDTSTPCVDVMRNDAIEQDIRCIASKARWS